MTNLEVYIFNEKLERIATIDNFIKMEWEENYFENDVITIEVEFKLITDITTAQYDKNVELFESLTSMVINEAEMLPRFLATNYFGNDNIRIASIDSFELDEEDLKLTINARGALSLLASKQAYDQEFIPSEDTNDSVGAVVCRLINEHVSVDPILEPIFEANELDNDVGEEVYYMTENGDNVYDSIIELLGAYDLGFQVYGVMDYNKKYLEKIVFKVIEPNDDIVLAVSKDDSNLISNKYEVDVSNMKNYIYITGTYTEDDVDRTIIEVVNNSNGGLIMSTNIDSSKKQLSLTEAEFREVLKTEAKIELENNKVQEDFEIEIDDSVDVSLGDVVVCKVDIGYKEIAKEKKVSVIKHTWENNLHTRTVDFGKPYNAKTEARNILGV